MSAPHGHGAAQAAVISTASVGSAPAARKACIAYITDAGYLFPTLLSAIQAAANVAAGMTDVVVCYIGAKNGDSYAIESVCHAHGIIFRRVAPAEIGDLPIMYARLFLDTLLGDDYRRIIYIDGDTQIAGDLQELADVSIPAGMILAVRDPMTLVIERESKTWREQHAYMKSIGLSAAHIGAYFNSGVICFNTADWAEIRHECLRLQKSRHGDFRFPDQDILNLAVRDRHRTISFKWNFPIYFLNHAGVESIVQPRVYHFMSNPRPWQGAFQPWGKTHFKKYDELTNRYPELLGLRERLPARTFWKYTLQQYYKLVAERLAWKSNEFTERIMRIESEAMI
jgi:lipopolysaccharide biosynthesis glycosyltransferase